MSSFERFLLDRRAVSAGSIERAKQACAESGERFAVALKRLGLLQGAELATAVAAYHNTPLVADAEWPQSPILTDVVSRHYLREHKVLPLADTPAGLLLATADPDHTQAIEAVRLATNRRIILRVAAAEDIEAAIDRLIAPAAIAMGADQSAGPADLDEDVEYIKDLALGAPVVQFVNQLLLEALHARATDIHIEPYRGRVNIRLRVDGMLRDVHAPPNNLARAIVSRVKILSGLDIAERRLPQDGRARVKIDARQFDLRVATMPTINGEAVAIRLLDNTQRDLDLGQLGFPDADQGVLRRHLAAPHGMILVTGPTGSGKTTTLAAALAILNQPHRKILTIEDPIEYQIDGVSQTQARPEIGITFAHAMRAFLRHDPDVIMVGEMRDTETARIAVQAALTGHVVLSTLHTNSAAGAITRLLDMGVDGYLLASSLRCVIGQRLVRVLCLHCRQRREAVLDLPADVLAQAGLRPGQPVAHWQARGCDRCLGSGYLGRTGIVEVLDIAERIQGLVKPGVSTIDIADAAVRGGMRTMVLDGLAKCLSGITTPDEVRRVALEA